MRDVVLTARQIFPLQVRAKGNAWGVVGWSIGNGWCVLLLPTIFARLHSNTLHIFGAVNVLSIIAVWALYPETDQRKSPYQHTIRRKRPHSTY